MPEQALHPRVAAAKFDREVSQLLEQTDRMRRRGVLVLDVAAPVVQVAFALPHIKPAGIVTAVRFDYTDYDLQPPSIWFVDPFSGERLRPEQMHTQMLRGVEQPLGVPGFDVGPNGQPMQSTIVVPQPLIQAHDGGWPFLCLPGVREYHEHPGHTGDPWELHRTAGAGSLVRLVETIVKYAVEPVADWGVQLVPRVGFNIPNPPPP